MSATRDAMVQRAAAAATAVFSIAELLEQIILDVVQNTPTRHAPGLGATLSQLTRVSQDFRSIIHDSPKLAYLATKTLQVSGSMSTSDRLHWLFIQRLGLRFSELQEYQDRYENHAVGLDGGRALTDRFKIYPRRRYSWMPAKMHEQTARMRSFRRNAGNKAASWRDIKLALEPSKVYITVADVACNFPPGSSRPLRQELRKDVVLEFDPEATLGVVFDKYCEIVDESMELRDIALDLRS